MPSIRFCLGMILVVLAVSMVSLAQTGSIAGTVTDPSGAVVPGADVTVRNTATNQSHSTTSGASGSYSRDRSPRWPL